MTSKYKEALEFEGTKGISHDEYYVEFMNKCGETVAQALKICHRLETGDVSAGMLSTQERYLHLRPTPELFNEMAQELMKEEEGQ